MKTIDLDKDWVSATAEELIVKERLRNSHGEVVCWGCRGRLALMPHLHCRQCYDEHQRRNGR